MFSSPLQPGKRPTVLGLYRNVSATTGVEGASAHKLVSLLYHAVSGEIAAARGALQRRDVVEKGRAIGHAVRILEEGLIAPLDMERGGAIATNLRDIYQYMVYRLTMGNLHHDDAALADCAGLARSLGDSWDAITPQVDAPAQAAA
ncbi:MAG TPA: flagellar export chaperone FliS [Caldimonas sp.]|nr:flagellar export chaperone FliS [Caldimonas sp.]